MQKSEDFGFVYSKPVIIIKSYYNYKLVATVSSSWSDLRSDLRSQISDCFNSLSKDGLASQDDILDELGNPV